MSRVLQIVFMGSPDFAVPSLEALVNHYSVVGVVSQPDRPAGRGGKLHPPAIIEASRNLGIPFIQPGKLSTPEVMTQLRAWEPELIVVAAFGQILRPAVLDLPKHGCLNVHGSLLPRWRGAAPIQAAILAGDHETGITIMKMDPGIDTGPILSQRAVPIAENDTGGSMFEKLAAPGADLLIETIPGYLNGNLIPQPQHQKGATYSPMLKKEDGLLDFTKPAAELERRVRAMHPWPGAFFAWNGAPIKVLKASVRTGKKTKPNTRIDVEGTAAIETGDGILILEEVQPAGKKVMSGKAFLLGTRTWQNK
jgi:methionyl-tRNA formyltransferase